jgi:glycolate dehydrogenase iron-sulfur subunit
MDFVNGTGAQAIVTANPGCMLQLTAGVQKFGQGQRVAHVVEILDEAYSKAIHAV